MSCDLQALPDSRIRRDHILRRAWRALTRRNPAAGAAANTLDLCTAPEDLLRDIGLRDGRGPSLRRPERAVPRR